MKPKTPVVSQEQIDRESDLAWKQLREQQEMEAEKEYENEVCPCGHKHDQHYAGEEFCEVSSCDCPQFGEPIENWETFTEVNLGDSPGGFRIYE